MRLLKEEGLAASQVMNLTFVLLPSWSQETPSRGCP